MTRHIPDSLLFDLIPHRHKWKLIRQVTSFGRTDINMYKCESCPKTKKTYQNPSMKKEMEEKKFFKLFKPYGRR